jgi:hypothetical protein
MVLLGQVICKIYRQFLAFTANGGCRKSHGGVWVGIPAGSILAWKNNGHDH